MPPRTWTADNPRALSGQTNIKAAHVNELRQVIAAWRSSQTPPLWAFRWTDTVSPTDSSLPPNSVIKAIHFFEIRYALRDCYAAKSPPAAVGPWSKLRTESQGPGPILGSPVFAEDLNDLRGWYEQLP